MKTSFEHCGKYEINISVKYNGKGSKYETQHFLNTLLCFIGEARTRYNQLGLHALEKEADDVYQGIMTTIKNQGFYNNL